MSRLKCLHCKKLIKSHRELKIIIRHYGQPLAGTGTTMGAHRILVIHSDCLSSYMKNRKRNIFGYIRDKEDLVNLSGLKHQSILDWFMLFSFSGVVLFLFLRFYKEYLSLELPTIILSIAPLFAVFWSLRNIDTKRKIKRLEQSIHKPEALINKGL